MASKLEFPIVQIKNLPFNHNPKDLFTLLGQFGNIHEIRTGSVSDVETRGQAIVVYTTLKAAHLALEKLSGFNYHGRYLVVKMYTPEPKVIDELLVKYNKNDDIKGL
ncbi:hypothetical protein CANINC_000985 [Pichia inconspicua]|uniref:RRM domain-containing protein n=1 Tax=Pichia inconspicua TaxID=52247 RepID=A0A4T0X6K1_9ASCO|nr:hypothetical protein CANINC_000985 [[Candida] inconspicua]